MAYCTQADIQNHLSLKNISDLSNDTPNAGTPDATVMTALIARASTQIDAALQGTFTVPLNPVPAIITNICVFFVIYFLYGRQSVQLEMPKNVEKQYQDSVDLLSSIARLETSLDNNVTPIVTPMADITSNPQLVNFTDPNNQMSFY